jgi:Dyp-type peroxidase family
VVAHDSWKLVKEHAARAQGLIVSAFPDLHHGEALFLQLPTRAGGAWLKALLEEVKVTDSRGRTTPSVALALTWTGLAAMGLDDVTLNTFAPAFIEGMRQIDRQRRLGDEVSDHVVNDTVIEGGPIWSGNAPERFHLPQEPDAKPTPITVHVALFLYELKLSKLAELKAKVVGVLAGHHVAIVRSIGLTLEKDQTGNYREHFGFVDGISQPVPYGPTIEPNERDPRHGVAAGDFLIGHENTDGDPAPGPIVSDEKLHAAALGQWQAPNGWCDLGMDGAYLVIRELRQEVRAFWDSMKAAASALGGGYNPQDVAARVVGRTLDGDPLVPKDDHYPDGVIPPTGAHQANDFGYFSNDQLGLGCPRGAHMRRANPRDGLAPNPGDADAFLTASNNHRILRRGRKFGPPYAENEPPGTERGLLFMAVNTDITRQFEFVQQTWVFNKSFAELFDETDPLVGPRGLFTIPEQPVRARVDVETFVRLVGGDYFFLPSLPAIDYLATLP